MVPLLAALFLLSQAPEPIRVTTRMVEVNVVVRDKNGPVTGLRADDFVLHDRGHLQKIAVFQENSSRVSRASAALAPGEFTNRPGGSANISQQAIAIVWDHLNTSVGDAEVARDRVLKALGQIETHDRVCLYKLDDELRVIQDFTSDSSLLVEALRKYREQKIARPVDVPLLGASPAGDPRVAEMFEAFNSSRLIKAANYRASVTAAAIRVIANHLAGVPGRKSVIWIAGEFPGAAAALVYSGIAVYPVDLSGMSEATMQRSQMLRQIAQKSGGMAFIHSNLRGAIDQAVKDSEISYTLGFYPDRTPERINALKVEVARKGIEVGYRNAYSGIPRPSGSEIGQAIQSPLDATQISLNVHLRKQDQGWALAVEIDPSELAFENKDGRQSGGLEFAVRQLSTEGTDLGTKSSAAKFDLSPPQYLMFLNKKHEMSFTVPNPNPHVAAIRLVVEDRASGRLGSITIPVPR